MFIVHPSNNSGSEQQQRNDFLFDSKCDSLCTNIGSNSDNTVDLRVDLSTYSTVKLHSDLFGLHLFDI